MIEKRPFWENGEVTSIISSGLLILGALLPWVKAGWLSMLGLEGDGIFTALIGAIIIIILLCKKNPKMFIISMGVISTLLSLNVLFRSLSGLNKFEKAMEGNMFGGLLQAQIGSGLYLTLLASIGLIVGGFLIQKKDKSK